MSGSPRLVDDWKAGFSVSGFRLGRIEKIIEPGRFVVVLESGVRVTADGSKALKMGNRVRVFPSRETLSDLKAQKEQPADSYRGSATYWGAFLPLGFGGKKASTRLQIFVEEKQEGLWDKRSRAVYFIVWTQTEKLGGLQWSIYLRSYQVSLQVFAEQGVNKDELRDLVASVEKTLKSRGFSLLAPTVFLEHPFKAPEGFRLNVRG